MALPPVPLPTAVVEVGGQEVNVRGLSRAEAHLVDGKTSAETEIFLIAVATGETQEDVKAWLASVPSNAVDALVLKILELSGQDGLGNASSED